MDLSKNYYVILGVPNNADEKKIKKSYYKLSFIHHPDKNGDAIIFSEMTEAYDVLCSEKRSDYDLKSKFGSNYDESFELFNINIDLEYDDVKSTREKFKRNEVNDVIIIVDDPFNGSVEFERFVKCKPCDGTGKDFSSKIIIRDNDGNILKMFDADDGCDFCDGWYHGACVGITKDEANLRESYLCPRCVGATDGGSGPIGVSDPTP